MDYLDSLIDALMHPHSSYDYDIVAWLWEEVFRELEGAQK